MNDISVVIEWSGSDCSDAEDGALYVREWSGRILKRDIAGEDTEIGSITLQDIQYWRVTQSQWPEDEDDDSACIDLYSILDSIGGDEAGIYERLFDPALDELRESLGPVLGLDEDELRYIVNIIHLDKVVVYSDFRGNGYGLTAIKQALRHFESRMSLVYCYPSPLQHNHNDDNSLYPARGDEVEDTKKLVTLYEKLGLKTYFPLRKTQGWPRDFVAHKDNFAMVCLASELK